MVSMNREGILEKIGEAGVVGAGGGLIGVGPAQGVKNQHLNGLYYLIFDL